LVAGAGGFIGHHVVSYLKDRGYEVRGVDLKRPEFEPSRADDFLLLDLRDPASCRRALSLDEGTFDEVYQLAADMGGMGFISRAECEVLRHNALINLHMTHHAVELGVPRYFFSSSVCVYRDMEPGESALSEEDAVPAEPDNEYGWEKLYSERVALAFGRRSDTEFRVARFQNCYGPLGTWRGGREKAPAAICRKVAEAPAGGDIEVWGDGTAVRAYTYVEDMVEGIYTLTHSDLAEPVNIGASEYVSVDELVETVMDVAGKPLRIRHVEGPVGVQSRNFSHRRIESLGWRPRVDLREGLRRTYRWIEEHVREARSAVDLPGCRR
jgi:nucleoside-diphosphate-sugar epimerase